MDGQQIKGELITVKPKSLLLLDTEGKDVSIDIADIKVIRVVKKSKLGKGLLYGLLIGGGGGGLVGLVFGGKGEIVGLGYMKKTPLVNAVFWAIIFTPIGLLIGGFTGALLGTDKTVQIEGKSELEIQEALDKLRKKARIRDYK